MMIAFALINAFVTGVNVLFGQEKLLSALRETLRNSHFRQSALGLKGINVWRLRYAIYGYARASTTFLFACLVLVALVLTGYNLRKSFNSPVGDVRYATTQPFYYGIRSASFQPTGNPATHPPIRPQRISWSASKDGVLASPKLDSRANEIPLLYLEPELTPSSTDSSIHAFLNGILQGGYNLRLQRLNEQLKRYKRPVLVSFAPYFDDASRPWGTQNTAILLKYKRVFQYLTRYGQLQKTTNVIWMWCPAHPYTIFSYYPGHSFVDWIGLEIVDDPATAYDGESHSFSTLYQPLRHTLTRHEDEELRQKPVIITKMKTLVANEQLRWQTEAINHIQERYPEIRGILSW